MKIMLPLLILPALVIPAYADGWLDLYERKLDEGHNLDFVYNNAETPVFVMSTDRYITTDRVSICCIDENERTLWPWNDTVPGYFDVAVWISFSQYIPMSAWIEDKRPAIQVQPGQAFFTYDDITYPAGNYTVTIHDKYGSYDIDYSLELE